MSEKTNIAWCDSTVNFWSGCTKVSPGCVNCYAEVRDRRHMIEPVSHWGKGAPRLKHVGAVKHALAMNKRPFVCDGCGQAVLASKEHYCIGNKAPTFHRRRIFSLSLGDWLDDEVPIEWLAEMLETIRQCDQVIWILCTKRPENWHRRMTAVSEHHIDRSEMVDWLSAWRCGRPPANVWLLTSVENQAMADDRIPELLNIPAMVHGLSLEPLLGPVDLALVENGAESDDEEPWAKPTRAGCEIDWLIIGGESGPGARACNIDWIRRLQQQGQFLGIPVFVKQLGAFPVANQNDFWPEATFTAGCPEYNMVELKDKKGGDPAEWAAALRVQQFPHTEGTEGTE